MKDQPVEFHLYWKQFFFETISLTSNNGMLSIFKRYCHMTMKIEFELISPLNVCKNLYLKTTNTTDNLLQNKISIDS